MYLKPSICLSPRPVLEAETSFREAGGNVALLRVLVWLHIYSKLLLERSQFFENDNGYLLLRGAGQKYLVCANRGTLTLEAGGRDGIKKLYSGADEEEILRRITEAEYGL